MVPGSACFPLLLPRTAVPALGQLGDQRGQSEEWAGGQEKTSLQTYFQVLKIDLLCSGGQDLQEANRE